MRLVTFEHEGLRQAGVLKGDRVIPFRGVTELDRLSLACLPGDHSLNPARALPSAEVRLLPPVPRPGKIIGVGLNYKTHIHETGRDLPKYPVLFAKFFSALVGPFDPIINPAESDQLDYEGELAVVIGGPARRIAAADALSVVAGYAVANDVTVRDYQYKTHQWLQGKAWDSSTPLGPALVTPDEVGDPAELHVELKLNGEVMQSADVSAMIFDVASLISAVSEFTTLEAGDVLLTGTPGGVGFRRDPKVFLTDGDVVAVEIIGLGRIENHVMSETPC